MKVLIVEDDFASRKLIRKYMDFCEHCDVVVDGEEALEAFKYAFGAGDPYDLILLDIMLPKIDGQEVLRQIREIEAENNIHGLDGVKIVMVTALDDSKSILTAFKSQCEGYVTKPLQEDKLQAVIRELGFSI